MKYLQPKTLPELTEALGQMTEDSHLLAGCTDFLARRNGTCWDAEVLVSLSAMECLRRIEEQNGMLSVGALCTHTQVEEDPLVRKYFPALAEACGNVGSKQVRNRGTVGGSVGNASPAGDIYPVLLVLNGQAEILDSKGSVRRVPAEQVIRGIGKTTLARDEAITAFLLPLPEAGTVSAFAKLGERPKVTIAKINLALSAKTENGCLKDVRIALGAVAEKAFLSDEAAAVLEGRPLDDLPVQEFGEVLSQVIRRSIPTRASMPYKNEAVRGLAEDLLKPL